MPAHSGGQKYINSRAAQESSRGQPLSERTFAVGWLAYVASLVVVAAICIKFPLPGKTCNPCAPSKTK